MAKVNVLCAPETVSPNETYIERFLVSEHKRYRVTLGPIHKMQCQIQQVDGWINSRA